MKTFHTKDNLGNHHLHLQVSDIELKDVIFTGKFPAFTYDLYKEMLETLRKDLMKDEKFMKECKKILKNVLLVRLRGTDLVLVHKPEAYPAGKGGIE